MRLSDDELRSALRAEAATHRPDRDAMLHRITQTAMDPARPVQGRHRVRMTAAAAAVVAVLAGGGIANWALAGSSDPEPAPTATATTASPSPAASPSTTVPPSPATSPSRAVPASRAPGSKRPASRPAAPPSSPPAPADTPRAEQGPLWSDGSVDPEGRASVLTLKTTEQLTALEVIVRVARTDGLISRGGTKQTPGASVSTSVTEEPGALIYRFVLSSADTLAPGTYTFTAKYTHLSDRRDAGADTYEATATSANGAALKVAGDFY
ncbi:hypothetical protein OHA21_31035 [Actinoplanes sp. NBC_00393]|uniref:hypothetical protein n=1 Tax=Actinoplanes sp. NBC_00393 TaxID=2975953 RepID=UPI002E1AFE50